MAGLAVAGISAITPAAKAALTRALKKKVAAGGIAKKQGYRRRRTRLLTLSQREELQWISRHLGRTAAAERMAHYRR